MFTGIVEEVGTVKSIDRRHGYQRTVIEGKKVMDGLEIGDSISLGGACHTVVGCESSCITVESVDETLRRTTMGGLCVGDGVNLERSVGLTDRLDGHLVQGHVDGVGHTVDRREDDGNAVFTFDLPPGLCRYVAEKGSIAVDGISLTVVSVEDAPDGGRFSVAIIPHTLKVTTLNDKRVGDRVNLEVDIVARYLERLIGENQTGDGKLTLESIRTMGFES